MIAAWVLTIGECSPTMTDLFTHSRPILILVGGVVGLLPLSGTSERAAMAVCIGTVFFTNVLGSGLAGESIIHGEALPWLDMSPIQPDVSGGYLAEPPTISGDARARNTWI